jgi:hypothetical protein
VRRLVRSKQNEAKVHKIIKRKSQFFSLRSEAEVFVCLFCLKSRTAGRCETKKKQSENRKAIQSESKLGEIKWKK